MTLQQVDVSSAGGDVPRAEDVTRRIRSVPQQVGARDAPSDADTLDRGALRAGVGCGESKSAPWPGRRLRCAKREGACAGERYRRAESGGTDCEPGAAARRWPGPRRRRYRGTTGARGCRWPPERARDLVEKVHGKTAGIGGRARGDQGGVTVEQVPDLGLQGFPFLCRNFVPTVEKEQDVIALDTGEVTQGVAQQVLLDRIANATKLEGVVQETEGTDASGALALLPHHVGP